MFCLLESFFVGGGDHGSITLNSQDDSSAVHRAFPGQAVKHFTNTKCPHFRKNQLITSVHVKAVV